MELTKEEEKAIAALRRVAGKWPKTLMLFSANGSLYVMKLNEKGDHMDRWGDPDQSLCVTTISGIRNDGGDW